MRQLASMFPIVSCATGWVPLHFLTLRIKQSVTGTSRDLKNSPVFLIIRASTTTSFRRGGDGESSAIQNLQKMQQ